MKRFFSWVFALLLVVSLGLTSCSSASSPSGLTGNYRQDTLTVINTLRTALEMPEGTPEQSAAQRAARESINEFASRYRRDTSVARSSSFTTMRTALNSLAGHYSSYPNRPVPQKLKDRLEVEFKRVEAALGRGA
jgi:photosystem II Psb27 protein